jgi:hypothetical protein
MNTVSPVPYDRSVMPARATSISACVSSRDQAAMRFR